MYSTPVLCVQSISRTISVSDLGERDRLFRVVQFRLQRTQSDLLVTTRRRHHILHLGYGNVYTGEKRERERPECVCGCIPVYNIHSMGVPASPRGKHPMGTPPRKTDSRGLTTGERDPKNALK